jgi:hypothetical protein
VASDLTALHHITEYPWRAPCYTQNEELEVMGKDSEGCRVF